MRALRAGLVAAVAAVVLLTPAAASAQISEVTIGTARLGPNGVTVDVPVNVVCDVGYVIGFVHADVVQSGGRKQSSGDAIAFPPDVPCTGAPQLAAVVTVATTTSFAYKAGKATATAEVIVGDPVTFNLFVKDVGPTTIQIKKR